MESSERNFCGANYRDHAGKYPCGFYLRKSGSPPRSYPGLIDVLIVVLIFLMVTHGQEPQPPAAALRNPPGRQGGPTKSGPWPWSWRPTAPSGGARQPKPVTLAQLETDLLGEAKKNRNSVMLRADQQAPRAILKCMDVTKEARSRTSAPRWNGCAP